MQFWAKLSLRQSIFLFALGILLAAAFTLLAAWGDLEASVFNSALGSQAGLRTLFCPVLATTADRASVSITVTNPTEKPMARFVRASVSQGYVTLIKTYDEQFTIAPDESRLLSWPIEKQDAVWGWLVMARVYLFPSYPFPSEAASCGIFLVDLPIGGSLLTILWIALAVGFAAAGGLSWHAQTPPASRAQVSRLAGILSFAGLGGILSSLVQLWLASVFFLLVIVLLTLVIFTIGLQKSDPPDDDLFV
jgi:hypothetical protein